MASREVVVLPQQQQFLEPEQEIVVPPSSSTPRIVNVSKRKLENSALEEEANRSILTRKRRKLLGSPSKHRGVIEAHGNKIVDSTLLIDAINAVTKCVKCSKTGNFTLLQNNNKRKGLQEVLIIKCQNCKNEHSFNTSQQKVSRGGGTA